ncbi:MAG: sulfatase-like hydrolase/transferase [Vicinamibacterales bacterium]
MKLIPLALAAATAFSIAPAGGIPQDTARPMNVVMLVIDDTRWDSIAAAGNSIVRTPRIDALAAEGIRFTQARVATSICMTSRASLLTGQYMSRHGIDRFGTPLTPDAFAQTYPGLLRSAGYWTGYVGKYGVGAARPADFDFLRAYEGRHWITGADGERVHVTEKNARDSVEFLRARPREKPFLLSVGYFAPHAEDSAKEQYPTSSSST